MCDRHFVQQGVPILLPQVDVVPCALVMFRGVSICNFAIPCGWLTICKDQVSTLCKFGASINLAKIYCSEALS
jgi:hypothetical protein